MRELRNAIERSAHLDGGVSGPVSGSDPLSYQQAKEQATAAWERAWIDQLLDASGGNLSLAARTARMGRSHLRMLARRHGLVTRTDGADLADDGARPEDPA